MSNGSTHHPRKISKKLGLGEGKGKGKREMWVSNLDEFTWSVGTVYEGTDEEDGEKSQRVRRGREQDQRKTLARISGRTRIGILSSLVILLLREGTFWFWTFGFFVDPLPHLSQSSAALLLVFSGECGGDGAR